MNLYPSTDNLHPSTDMDNLLNKSRINEMINKRQELERQLQHYIKIKKRWSNADLSVKIVGALLAAIGTTGGTVVGAIGAVPIAIPIIVGSLTAGETIITSGLVLGLTSRKTSRYREKIKIIQSYVDRMFVYIEKARQDSIITIEELEGFRKLMEEYQNANNNNVKPLDYDYDKLKKQAEKEAEKKVKELIKKSRKFICSIKNGCCICSYETIESYLRPTTTLTVPPPEPSAPY
jgi:hypothetical protein